jgi:shikimate kinase
MSKNIYLVGFMGTGKTSAGQLLAREIGATFVDMDEEIERREKLSIPDIFRTKGEAYFRSAESSLVEELSKQEGLVVSCGGGSFVDAKNIAALKSSGIVFCLTSSPETILVRTRRFAHRPLLNVDDPKSKIEELLRKRAPFYAQAHHTIDCDTLTVAATVRQIRLMLKDA